jgi:hypothetical protein
MELEWLLGMRYLQGFKRSVLGRITFAVFRSGIWIAGRERRARDESRSRSTWKTRSIWSGMGAQLCEVEIGPGLVTKIHRLSQLALRVVTVEDNDIDADNDNFYNYLDDATHKGPILKR